MALPLRSDDMAEEVPAISQQRVIIPNKHGEKLVGILHEAGSKKLAILCHGFRASKDDKTLLNLTAALTRQGISTFRFDFAGNGEKMAANFVLYSILDTAKIKLNGGFPDDFNDDVFHHLGQMRESEGVFQYGNYRREADDLHAVVLYWSKQKYEVSAIIGHSKGGNVVLLYASMYHDVPIVINLSGRYALDRGIEDRLGKDFMQRIKKDGFIDVKDKTGEVGFRVTEESLMDRLNTDMHAASLSIDKACRVFTVHGSEDEIIPAEDALEFAKLIPNHELRIVEGANHCYTAHQEVLASVVVGFLKSDQVEDASAAGDI